MTATPLVSPFMWRGGSFSLFMICLFVTFAFAFAIAAATRTVLHAPLQSAAPAYHVCRDQLSASTKKLPLTIRFSDSFSSVTPTAFRLPYNLLIVEQALLAKTGINTSITVGPRILNANPEENFCDSPISSSVPDSFEIRLCTATTPLSSPESTYPKPPSTVSTWCSTTTAPSELSASTITEFYGQPFGAKSISTTDFTAFTSSLLRDSDQVVLNLVDEIDQWFRTYFVNSASTSLCDSECFFDPSSADQTCGDGRLGRDEECDISPVFTLASGYFDATKLSTYQTQLNCDTSCKHLTTSRPLYSNLLNQGLTPESICLADLCGFSETSITSYRCQSSNGATEYNRDACFAWIGLQPPTFNPVVECYNGASSKACTDKNMGPGWVCRRPDVEYATAISADGELQYDVIKMDFAWNVCGESWSDLFYIESTTTPGTLHPLQRNQVTCETAFLRRSVRCGVVGSAIQFKEEDCAGLGTKPLSSISIPSELQSCSYLGYKDYLELTGDPTTTFPALNSAALAGYSAFTADYSTYTTLDDFAKPVAPAPQLIKSCSAKYYRHYACLKVGYVPVPGSIIGELKRVVEMVPKAQCPGQLQLTTASFHTQTDELALSVAATSGDRCTIRESCGSQTDPNDPLTEISCDAEKYDCKCSTPQIEQTSYCWAFPPAVASFKAELVAASLCGMSQSPVSNFKICTLVNQVNNCYKYFLFLGTKIGVTTDEVLPASFYQSNPAQWFTSQYCASTGLFSPQYFQSFCSTYDSNGALAFVNNGLCSESELACSTDYYYKCTAPIQVYNADVPSTAGFPTLAILQQFGYDNAAANVYSFEKCARTYKPSMSYCGEVRFAKQTKCFKLAGGVETEVNLNECVDEGLDTPTTSPKAVYKNNCNFNCYDNNKLVDGKPTLLGRCPSDRDTLERLDHQSFSCGLSSQTDNVCALSSYNVEAKCQMKLQNKSEYVYVDITKADSTNTSVNGCFTLIPSDLNYSWNNKSTIVDPCFKLSPSKSLSIYSFRSKAYSLQSEFSDSGCKFETQCRYDYLRSASQPNILTLDTTPIDSSQGSPLAGVFSAAACSASFECSRTGICGTVVPETRCRITRNDVEVDFGASRTADGPLSSLAKALGINDVTQSICSKLTVPSGCTNTLTTNCYARRCGMSTDSAALNTKPTDNSVYSTSMCDSKEQYKHCTEKLTGAGFCNDSQQATLYTRCTSLRDNKPSCATDTCASDEVNCLWDGDTGARQITCPNFKSCAFDGSGCFWRSTQALADQYGQNVFAYPDTPSKQLCTDVQNVALTEAQVCSNSPLTNLCGHAEVTSSCVVKDPATPSKSFVLSNDVCNFYHGPNGINSNSYIPVTPDNSVHGRCENYNRCSTRVCTTSFTNPTTYLSNLNKINLLASSPPQSTQRSTFFSSGSSGTMNEDHCTAGLDVEAGEKSICGIGLIQRNVNCIQRRTDQYFSTSSIVIPKDQHRCGETSTIAIPPISALPFVTTEGCASHREYSSGGSPFTFIDSLYALRSLSQCPITYPTNATFPSSLQCVSANSTIIPNELCPTSILDQIGSQSSCKSCTPGQVSRQIPLSFSPTSTLMTDALGRIAVDIDGNPVESSCLNRFQLQRDPFCTDKAATTLSFTTSPATLSSLAPGQSFTIYTTITNPTFASTALYLVPINPDNSSHPAFTSPFSLAIVSQNVQKIAIPQTVKPGTYILVAFHDAFTLTFTATSHITITPPTSSTAPTADADPSCDSIACFNGACKNGVCTCYEGFIGDSCLVSEDWGSICSDVTTVPNPAAPTTNIQCHAINGIVGPSFAKSKDLQPDVSSFCQTCHCLGQFDPTDGCSTCLLDCSNHGSPTSNCSKCQCEAGFSGHQCGCYTKATQLSFITPPSIVTKYLAHFDSGTSWDEDDEYALMLWKRNLIYDVARDVDISVDYLSIDSFGLARDGDVDIHGVRPLLINFEVKSCTSVEEKDGSASESKFSPELQSKIDASALKFASLARRLNQYSPFVDFDDTNGYLAQLLTPSFNYTTLSTASTSAEKSTKCQVAPSPVATLSTIHHRPLQTDATDSIPLIPLVALGVSSDSSSGGAFKASGRLFDKVECAAGKLDECPQEITTDVPTPRSPPSPSSGSKPLAPGIIAAIVVSIIGALIIAAAIVAFICCNAYREKHKNDPDVNKPKSKTRKTKKQGVEMSKPTNAHFTHIDPPEGVVLPPDWQLCRDTNDRTDHVFAFNPITMETRPVDANFRIIFEPVQNKF